MGERCRRLRTWLKCLTQPSKDLVKELGLHIKRLAILLLCRIWYATIELYTMSSPQPNLHFVAYFHVASHFCRTIDRLLRKYRTDTIDWSRQISRRMSSVGYVSQQYSREFDFGKITEDMLANAHYHVNSADRSQKTDLLPCCRCLLRH